MTSRHRLRPSIFPFVSCHTSCHSFKKTGFFSLQNFAYLPTSMRAHFLSISMVTPLSLKSLFLLPLLKRCWNRSALKEWQSHTPTCFVTQRKWNFSFSPWKPIQPSSIVTHPMCALFCKATLFLRMARSNGPIFGRAEIPWTRELPFLSQKIIDRRRWTQKSGSGRNSRREWLENFPRPLVSRTWHPKGRKPQWRGKLNFLHLPLYWKHYNTYQYCWWNGPKSAFSI